MSTDTQRLAHPAADPASRTYTKPADNPSRTTPVPWTWSSPRPWLHVASIVLSLVVFLLQLTPLQWLDDPRLGESFQMLIVFFAILSFQPLMCLFFSLSEIFTRTLRPGNSGIHPFAYLTMAIITLLATLVNALIITIFVSLKTISDKEEFEDTYKGDTCYDRSLWNTDAYDDCNDGFYDHEAYYVALAVLGWLLWLIHCALTCYKTPTDVRARRKQRREARALGGV